MLFRSEVFKVPAASSTWQWQLTGTLNTSYNATVYDIDLVDASAVTIAQLKSAGINPGTSADLTVATAMLAELRHGT